MQQFDTGLMISFLGVDYRENQFVMDVKPSR